MASVMLDLSAVSDLCMGRVSVTCLSPW